MLEEANMYKKSRSTIFGDIQRATDAVRKNKSVTMHAH